MKLFRHPGGIRRTGAAAVGMLLSAGLLAACSGGSDSDELVWFTNPDTGGQAELAKRCSTDEYTITTQVLPQDASQQRVQLIRRLAARDPEIDLMSLDPPFTAEFAAADYLEPMPEELAQTLTEQSFEGATQAAMWNDQMVVAPFWSNTQVLWYRESFVQEAGLDMSQPVTWEQIIQAADENNGTIGVQANKYEGYVVWINALIEGAGGHIVDNPEEGRDAEVSLAGEGAQAAAEVINMLASSDAAPSDLSVSNEGTAAATFGSDQGAFQVNWTFIWTNYGDDPVSEDIGYTMYPRTVEDEPARPPYGGIGLGVNKASEKKDAAMEAVECITSPESQGWYAADSGNMPASAAGYDTPELRDVYPQDLLDLFQESVDQAAPRTVSPYWSDLSSSIQNTWHPPSAVDQETPEQSQAFIEDVLAGRRLL